MQTEIKFVILSLSISYTRADPAVFTGHVLLFFLFAGQRLYILLPEVEQRKQLVFGDADMPL